MKKVAVLLLVLFSSFVLGEMVVNEVMYNPGQCGDSDCEWVELYNPSNETIDLSGWTIDGKNFDDVTIASEEYILIAKKLIDLSGGNSFEAYWGNNDSVWDSLDGSYVAVDGDFSLTNDEDTIILKNGSDELIDSLIYSDDWGADGNNKTLEMNKDGEWKESLDDGGTPGIENSVHDFSYDYTVLKINELLPSPVGGDEEQKPLGEWIEIYNSGSDPVDIKDLVFYDDNSNHWLKIRQTNVVEGTVVESGKYKVVYINGHYNFNLKAPDDEIKLYSRRIEEGGFLIDEFDYFSAPEGMSWSKIGEEWFLAAPTPSDENYYSEKCDWKIDIEMENGIFQTNQLDFTVRVERKYGFEQSVTVRGVIEDVFGEEVKTYSPWTDKQVVESSKKVGDYSPNGLDEETYMIKFWIEDLSCDEADLSDNTITKLIAINPQYKEMDSSILVENLYMGNDNSVEWGDQFTAKINVYKGDESRYSVQVWAEMDEEKVSKTTKFNIYDEYKNYPLTVPIQMEPNCHNKISDGKALLVVEAFGLREEREFEVDGVDGDVCKDYLDYVKDLAKEDSKKKHTYEVIDLPAEINSGEVLKVKLQVVGDSEKHDYRAWSYLYRGSKCYSCSGGERDSNLVSFDVGISEVKQTGLLVPVDEGMSSGEYRLKVKLNKDGQKTNKELTYTVYVKDEAEVSKGELSPTTLAASGEPAQEGGGVNFDMVSKKEGVLDMITGVVVYESSSERAYKLIPVFIIIVLGLVAAVLIFKKL